MPAMQEVPIPAISTERFRPLLGDDYAQIEDAIGRAHEVLQGRVVWHVNSTARGGGVAEMLHSLLAYGRGAGVDLRWVTIGGSPEFFALTKRLHNHLHESPGDGGELGRPSTRSTSGRCWKAQRALRPGPEGRHRLHPRSAARRADSPRQVG